MNAHAGQPAGPDPDHPTPELLLWAYCRGVFPMADPTTGGMEWYSPDPRGIIPLERFHAPKSLRRAVRQGRFEIRCDTAFEPVMRECAMPRTADAPTWIDERLIRAYTGLWRMGHAHSVEAWREKRLLGGLYGVHVNAAFFGESMFVKPDEGGTNASKICLVHLVHHLRARGFTLLDVQFINEHLIQFGCLEIPRDEYLERLREAVGKPVRWGRFEAIAQQP